MDNIGLVKLARSGDKTALEKLVEINKPLVVSIVKRFINRGAEMEDLTQIGMIGLIKAVKNFDFDYNTKFSTYAVPLIVGEIKRFLRDDGQIKVSRSIKDISQKINRYREDYIREHLKEPTIDTICENLGISKETCTLAVSAMMPVNSLYQQIGSNDEIYLLDTVPSSDNCEDNIDNIDLKYAVKSLKDREREIINLRYFKGVTQTQIAKILGISQVQVSRIEKKSLTKLKELVK